MEITIVNAIMFVGAFVFLFFVPGYFSLKTATLEERFVMSSAIVLIGSLLLSKTLGLTWLSLSVFVSLATLVLFYRSANL